MGRKTRNSQAVNSNNKENVANEKWLTLHIPNVTDISTEMREVIQKHYPIWHPIYTTKELPIYDYVNPKKPLYAEGPYNDEDPTYYSIFKDIYTNMCALKLKMT